MRSFTRSRRLPIAGPVCLAGLLVGLAAGACRRTVSPPGTSAFPELSRGIFLTSRPWIDPRELYRAQADASSMLPRLLPTHLASLDSWAGPEDWGAWSLEDRMTFRFFPDPYRVVPHDFYLECRAPEHPEGREQEVTVAVDGEEIGSFSVGAEDWQTVRLPIPHLLRPGEHRIELRFAYHLDPIPDRDLRLRSLGFRRLGILPAGEEPPPAPAASRPAFRLDDEEQVFELVESGTYLVPLEIPETARGLELEARSREEPASGSMLKVGLLTADGESAFLATLQGSPSEPLRLDLEAFRRRLVFLVLDIAVAGGNAWRIEAPRWVPAGAAETRAAAPETSARSAPRRNRRANVVVIVLDAARKDHFGAYGYPRPTTPHIDRLAAESLVFEEVTAECSYTLCSAPSMFTGLSFLRHGTVLENTGLNPDVETLAETLDAHGYHTWGFTGNPNNAKATGMDQGFDEFTETWETRPESLTRAAVERLAAYGGEPEVGREPFFLMLHYVPPHEPYTPDPAFDIFGDPEYRGPVTGESESTREIFDGRAAVDQADLEELIALYDGNLRMVDASVAEVFATLRSTGLWDDTVVIVTADHGEGFLEHGLAGHSKSVYEEMLQVPLILKPPADLGRRPADTRSLASLTDLAPTVLDLLGLPRPALATGVSLFDPRPRERVLFLRSSGAAAPVLGIRTPRYKTIAQIAAAPQLYDLRLDGGEHHNLYFDHRRLHAGMMSLLLQALEAGTAVRAPEREGTVSDEEQAMLRALGYL